MLSLPRASIPGQGTKILQGAWRSQIIKRDWRLRETKWQKQNSAHVCFWSLHKHEVSLRLQSITGVCQIKLESLLRCWQHPPLGEKGLRPWHHQLPTLPGWQGNAQTWMTLCKWFPEESCTPQTDQELGCRPLITVWTTLGSEFYT